MLITIADVLTAEELAALSADLAGAAWQDGKATAGRQSAEVKANRQLARDDAVTQRWGQRIGDALGRNSRFMTSALPLRILPPLFSHYAGGEHYGIHVDTAIRAAGAVRVRTDLAATLFVADPASYDGGELSIETQFGTQQVKLPAGGLVLYPASSRHQVLPVTRGVRLAAVFWLQSLVREDAARETLFTLDEAIQSLGDTLGRNDARVVNLSAIYHNLLRRWAET